MRRALLLVVLAACGGGGAARPAAVKPPPRATTAGDPLLAFLPAGADAVAEIDLARLRDNEVLAGLVEAAGRREALGIDPLRDIDVAAAAVYRLGEDDAGTLFVLRGEGLRGRDDLPDADRLDERTVLVGPAELRALPRAGPSDAFLALRAAAMPSKASGASVRVTARLTPRARVAAAGRMAVDEVPETVSLWLDVADDAALIAHLGGHDAADARRLLELLDDARAPAFLPPRDGLRAELRGATVRIVWVLTPRRFSAWARQLQARLGGTS